MQATIAGLILIAGLAAGCGKDAPPSEKNTPAATKAPAAKPAAPPAAAGDIPAPSDVAAPPADAAKTLSGLASKLLSPGTDPARPAAEDMVKVHYTGWTTDGKMFDSSVKRGTPATFGLNQVIAGWTEGLQLMTKGEKRRLWIPEALAYKGQPGKPAGMLVFDVELLDIVHPPKPIPAPSDVAAPPRDAQGLQVKVSDTATVKLSSKVLQKGTGKLRPLASDTVKVHYTGWTTDGKMFDSSVVRGAPAVFPLKGVIAGWTNGVPLMVEGEKRRFWIPEELAYKGQPGRPAGMLVFDVELLSIEKPVTQ